MHNTCSITAEPTPLSELRHICSFLSKYGREHFQITSEIWAGPFIGISRWAPPPPMQDVLHGVGVNRVKPRPPIQDEIWRDPAPPCKTCRETSKRWQAHLSYCRCLASGGGVGRGGCLAWVRGCGRLCPDPMCIFVIMSCMGGGHPMQDSGLWRTDDSSYQIIDIVKQI